MVKVFKGTKQEYYMDGYLKSNLDVAKKVIKQDWDMLFVVDGAEGSGKSIMAMQMAYFCDPKLKMDNIVFTPTEFRKRIMNSKPFEAIVYDEAYTGLSSRATMSLINRTLIGMLAEIRQKNLFVFVVMPTFFDLDKYAALWRSRGLIHVYTQKNFQRGFFSFYNADRKKQLYMLGKKFYNYYKPPANFIGRFTKFCVVNEKGYRIKKKNSLIEREKKREQREIRAEVENIMFERVMAMGKGVPHTVKMKVLAMPSSTYFLKLKQYDELKDLE